MQSEIPEFWKLFKPSACSIGLKGEGQEEVFRELVQNLVKAKLLAASLESAAVQALLERERLASTGVGRNVAIPHVMLKGIERAVVSLSVHQAGVSWKALDGEPVHLFFVVLRPESAGDKHDPDRHLDMMRWISLLGRNDDFCRFAKNVSNRTELVALLKEKSAV